MAAPEYDSYRKLKVLGEGAFGKAILVEDIRDGMQWVMKQIDLSSMPQKEKEETIKEAKILQYLDHPNIVKFKDVYATKKGKLCIVMEYADGGDLALKIKNQQGKLFSEQQILDWFTQIGLALKHVHDRKILHRDLKGQNIFLTRDNRVKLGDFGIARVLGNTLDKVKTQVGTPYYLSPEIIESKPYSYASDIWSLGAILYELCTLKPPFLADSLHFLALKIIKGQFSPISNQYSRDLTNLVKTLLQTQPLKRPSINQILKMPIVITRIKEFLTESVQKVEFAHTILHKQKLNCQVKLSEIKVIDEDQLRPPPNLLIKQSSSQTALQPPPQISKPSQQPQQIPQQQYISPQQFVPKQSPPYNPQVVQVQANQRQAIQPQQAQQQPKNAQILNKNAQIRNEKPLVQQHVIQQPKQYVQQPRREATKPNSAAQVQKQRNNSRNKIVDIEKQEQERKKMQQIKYEADLRRKEEEKKKLLKIQQEEDAKKRFKEDQKKKREQQQKEMRDDLQKKRQQLQQQQSQPSLGEPEPIYIVRQNYSQPQQQEELEEYNSDEDTQEYHSAKKSNQQQSYQNFSEDNHFSEENNNDDKNMDYGLKQEQNQAEIDALQQAILCKEYEKVLEEVQEANNKVNQIDDAQFEKNRQKILEQFEIDEVIDMDDLEDEEEEEEEDLNLTKTNNAATNEEMGLDYFQNSEALRGYLEQVLGKDKFQKAYNVSSNELFQYSIEEIEQRINRNNYIKILPFFTQEEAKQFIPLVFQLVIMDNSPK